MHDGGNYFLNFQLLPEDWKAAYFGASEEGESSAEPEIPSVHDSYKAGSILEKIPDLSTIGRLHLLRKDLPVELDRYLLDPLLG